MINILVVQVFIIRIDVYKIWVYGDWMFVFIFYCQELEKLKWKWDLFSFYWENGKNRLGQEFGWEGIKLNCWLGNGIYIFYFLYVLCFFIMIVV